MAFTNADIKIAVISGVLAALGTLLLRAASKSPSERYYTPTYIELRMQKEGWVKCQNR